VGTPPCGRAGLGLHLCCSVSWDLVERAEPDLLSFDLAVACIDRRAATALERLLARGTRLAWGILAAHRPEHALHGARRLSFVLARVPATGEQSLLAASCGTGRMAPRRERQVASALAAVAARRRRRHRTRRAKGSLAVSRRWEGEQYVGRDPDRCPRRECRNPMQAGV
jgi:hypothetical protein